MFGLPDAPYVVVPYTMTSRSRDEAASDVELVFEDLVAGMTTQPIPSNGYVAGISDTRCGYGIVRGVRPSGCLGRFQQGVPG